MELIIDLYFVCDYTKVDSLVLVDLHRPSRLPKAMGSFSETSHAAGI